MDFFRKKKSLLEIIHDIEDALSDDFDPEKQDECLNHNLTTIHDRMRDVEDEPSKMTQEILNVIHNTHLFNLLVRNFNKMNVNTSRIVLVIFRIAADCTYISEGVKNQPTIDYIIHNNKSFLYLLTDGYEDRESMIMCGQMLRLCFTYIPLRILLYTECVDCVFRYMDYLCSDDFEVASDSYEVLNTLFASKNNTNKELASQFLFNHCDEFHTYYQKLLNCELYFVQRRSLELLGYILTYQSKFRDKFLADDANLKLIMHRMINPKESIIIPAYHVFKVFVICPNRSNCVENILSLNRDRIIQYLTTIKNIQIDVADNLLLIEYIKKIPVKQIPRSNSICSFSSDDFVITTDDEEGFEEYLATNLMTIKEESEESDCIFEFSSDQEF